MLKHPFLLELASGELPPSVFDFYSQQDSYYLTVYSTALKQLASLTTKDKPFFLHCAKSCEQEPHQSNTSPKTWHQLTPSCLSYTLFLQAHCHSNYAQGLAAVLPCFLIYQRVALNLNPNDQKNPYKVWFDTYTSATFAKQCLKVLTLLKQALTPINTQQMMTIIEQGCYLEWAFWDDSYRGCLLTTF